MNCSTGAASTVIAAASSRIAVAIHKLSATISGPAMFGSTCRVITRNGEAPSATADSMKTSFFSERVSANTRRAQNGQ
jgi:hypothetical protein